MAKADVAPRATFSSSSGRLTHHTSQAQPDNVDNNEEPEQEESRQQESGDGNNDVFMASGQSKAKLQRNVRIIRIVGIIKVFILLLLCLY